MVYSVAALAWSVVYSYGLVDCFKLAVLMILRDFLLVGIIVATIFWLVSHAGQPLRLIEPVQGILEQCPARPSITLNCGRFQGRVGIRVRRAHKRLLPALSDTIPGTTFPRPVVVEEQLGLSLVGEYALPGCVSRRAQCRYSLY
jgi:UNC-50 family